AIMVFPEPLVEDDGSTCWNFLVHGIRHAACLNPDVGRRLVALREGDLLLLIPESMNEINPRAIYTADHERVPLGWVPDLLLDYLHTVCETGPYEVRVQHVNGPEAPVHLRLLARLSGSVPTGYEPFSGSTWEPLS